MFTAGTTKAQVCHELKTPGTSASLQSEVYITMGLEGANKEEVETPTPKLTPSTSTDLLNCTRVQPKCFLEKRFVVRQYKD